MSTMQLCSIQIYIRDREALLNEDVIGESMKEIQYFLRWLIIWIFTSCDWTNLVKGRILFKNIQKNAVCHLIYTFLTQNMLINLAISGHSSYLCLFQQQFQSDEILIQSSHFKHTNESHGTIFIFNSKTFLAKRLIIFKKKTYRRIKNT